MVWTPEETVIGHVHFHVSNLHDARVFYCDVLGFELTAHYGGLRCLYLREGTITISGSMCGQESVYRTHHGAPRGWKIIRLSFRAMRSLKR